MARLVGTVSALCCFFFTASVVLRNVSSLCVGFVSVFFTANLFPGKIACCVFVFFTATLLGNVAVFCVFFFCVLFTPSLFLENVTSL